MKETGIGGLPLKGILGLSSLSPLPDAVGLLPVDTRGPLLQIFSLGENKTFKMTLEETPGHFVMVGKTNKAGRLSNGAAGGHKVLRDRHRTPRGSR